MTSPDTCQGPNPKSIEPLVVVSGQPRSGTSLMMKILWKSGFHIISDEQMSFELKETTRLNEGNGWIMNLPPKSVIKVLYPHVMHLPVSREYKVIWMKRDPKEQAKSQRNFAGHSKLWVLTGAKNIRERERVFPGILARLGASVLQLRFETLIHSPDIANRELVRFLELDSPLDMSSVVPRRTEWSSSRPIGTLERRV